jgi:hypothetical protein
MIRAIEQYAQAIPLGICEKLSFGYVAMPFEPLSRGEVSEVPVECGVDGLPLATQLTDLR